MWEEDEGRQSRVMVMVQQKTNCVSKNERNACGQCEIDEGGRPRLIRQVPDSLLVMAGLRVVYAPSPLSDGDSRE